MKKAGLVLIAAGLLVACNVTVVVPGPPAGTPVTVDGDAVAATLAAGERARFEVVVGAEAVRVDVAHQEATANGELYVEVFDSEDRPYAHTDNRDFFARADASLAALSARAQDIDLALPYSVNLPANAGKVYVEVKNETAQTAHVTVSAVTRNTVVRENTPVTNPDTDAGEAAKIYGGALLFLGQRDAYVYQGADNYRLTLSVPGIDRLGVRVAIAGTGTVLEPGGSAVLLNGDVLEVYAVDGARAGFCATFTGCADGIDTGEYTLTIEP